MALPSMPAVTTLSNTNNKTKKGVQVKEEKPEDAEITALAAKMVEANKAKMAAAAATTVIPGRPNTISNFLNRNKSSNQTSDKSDSSGPDKPPFDLPSTKGKFGWTVMGEENIPFIFRGEDKYCAVRMVELKLLAKYLNHLNPDIYTCACIRSYFITEAEARLLSEINIRHCEGRFGRETYTTRDLVVRLHDASEFYYFLDLCYNKLVNPMSSMKQMCGFIRINGESVVPYAYKDSKQYVPLFYFEGETETLKDKAVTLEGWDLAYLKFCCKVQGIRSELFESDTCVCISLDHIKNYFAGGTVFDEYWPPKMVESSLLLAQKAQRPASWTKAPPPVSPVTSTPSTAIGTEEPMRAPVRVAPSSCQVSNGWRPPILSSQQQQQRYYNTLTVSAPAQRSSVQLPNMHTGHSNHSHLNPSLTNRTYQGRIQQLAASSAATFYPPVSHNSGVSLGSSVHHQAGQPPPLVRVTAPSSQITNPTYSTSNLAMQQNNSMQMMSGNLMPPPSMQYSLNNNNNNSTHNKYVPPPLIPMNGNAPPPRYYGSGADVIDLSSPPQSPQRGALMSNGTQLQKQVNQPSHRLIDAADQRRKKKLIQIGDTPIRQSSHYPFKMQKALVNGKMVPCINAKPYAYSELLMTINDLLDYFFPQVSVSKCREVLQDVLNVDLFCGNLQQRSVLRDNHKCKSLNEELPLIQLKDVVTFMPQMMYVMGRISPSSEEDARNNSASKRQRVS